MQILPVLSSALDARNSVMKLRRVLGCLGDVARAEEAERLLPAAAYAQVAADVAEASFFFSNGSTFYHSLICSVDSRSLACLVRISALQTHVCTRADKSNISLARSSFVSICSHGVKKFITQLPQQNT
jgi:hypothetical protein